MSKEIVKIEARVLRVNAANRKLIGFEVIDGPPHVFAHMYLDIDNPKSLADLIIELSQFGYRIEIETAVEPASIVEFMEADPFDRKNAAKNIFDEEWYGF